jgi:Leucine-rich repeat (LRR) protein
LKFYQSEIGKLSNLTFLSVDNNRLLSLPASVANLHKLKALCLAANDGLGPSLANLGLPSCADQPQQQQPPPTQQRQLFPELCVLSLERTGLASLPPFVCEVASLTALSLGFNSLTSLPADFAQLQRLKVRARTHARTTGWWAPQRRVPDRAARAHRHSISARTSLQVYCPPLSWASPN